MKICKRGHEYAQDRKKCPECQKQYLKNWRENNKDTIDRSKFIYDEISRMAILFCTGRSYLI